VDGRSGRDGDLATVALVSTPSASPAQDDARPGRFLTLVQVAEELNISQVQARALVRSRDLVGIQIGGRGQWRVERLRLEEYIQRLYRAGAAESGVEDDELPTATDDHRTDGP
jgi:prophage regulatory protein